MNKRAWIIIQTILCLYLCSEGFRDAKVLLLPALLRLSVSKESRKKTFEIDPFKID